MVLIRKNFVNFSQNWPIVPGEEDLLISSMYFRYFVIISPLKQGGSLHLYKLEFPSPKDVLCQVWLKLAHCSWRRRYFNFVNVFLLFCYYLPLEKGGALHLNKLELPLPKDALCQVWFKKIKMLKGLQTDGRMTDNRRSEISARVS